jgi:hypothetical protein
MLAANQEAGCNNRRSPTKTQKSGRERPGCTKGIVFKFPYSHHQIFTFFCNANNFYCFYKLYLFNPTSTFLSSMWTPKLLWYDRPNWADVFVKAANESMIKNLTRENALITTAWYDLTSRLQSNHVVLQRRQDAPKSWLNKQRQMVNATPRR